VYELPHFYLALYADSENRSPGRFFIYNMGVCLPIKKIALVPMTSVNTMESLNDFNRSLKIKLISLHLLSLKTQQEFEIALRKDINFPAIFHKVRQNLLNEALETIREFLTVIDPLNQTSMDNEEVKDFLEQGNILTQFLSEGIFSEDFKVDLNDERNAKTILKKVCIVDCKFFKELEKVVEDDRRKLHERTVEGYVRTRYIKVMSEKIKP